MVLTYLPLGRLSMLPRFATYTRRIQRQLDAAPVGLAGYSMLAKPHRSKYWTLTAWDDAAAMAAFIEAPPHLDAMAELDGALRGFRTTQWKLPGSALPPSWDDALART